MIIRPSHMLISPNLRSGCSCESQAIATGGGIGCGPPEIAGWPPAMGEARR